jgi:hypothetical protein
VVTRIESKRMMCDRVKTYYLTGEPLRVNIAKRKTILDSLFFVYVFEFGRGSRAKSFSLNVHRDLL